MSIYYVIESEYVGPNTQGRIDSHLVTITTDAPRTNLSHEVRLDGWIGTTNDTSRHAHGAYTSEDDAREAVAELFGPCRESDEIDDPDTVALFRIGGLEPWGSEASVSWCWTSRDLITASTTDEEIYDEVGSCAEAAAADGVALAGEAVEEMLREYRDELRIDEWGDADTAERLRLCARYGVSRFAARRESFPI